MILSKSNEHLDLEWLTPKSIVSKRSQFTESSKVFIDNELAALFNSFL